MATSNSQTATPTPTLAYDVPAEWRNPTIKMLNQRHPEYKDFSDYWGKTTLLYEGGHTLKKAATQFLQRRPRELQEIYQARVDRFTYHNVIGTCFGWYRGALFKNPPTILGKVVDANGLPTKNKFPDNLDEFYNEFRKNCDRKRTSFLDLFKDVWTNLALYRTAYVLVDLPPKVDAPNLRAQKLAGILDKSGKPSPYLCPYNPTSVTNWGIDEYGNLDWCLISCEDQKRGFLQDDKIVDTWYYFDRVKFMVYERERQENETSMSQIDENQRATMVDNGPHCLSKYSICPLMKFEVTEDLWLANRAYLPVLDHLNQDNSYSWALYLSNLAMPVITSDADIKPQLSEAGFIKLPAGSTYEWTEPEGKSFQRSEARVKELREEIYRMMYLTYQGKSSTATADGASGASKEMDMMPAQDVMNEFGDVLVAGMQLTMNMVALAHEDENVQFDVRGMKYGKTATMDDIQKTEAVIALGVPSDTFQKEVYKQAVDGVLPDANPETKETIFDEIDAAPGLEEQAKAEATQRMTQYATAMTTAVQAFNKPPQPSVPTPKPVKK